MAARMAPRRSSIGVRRPARSTCQNVQPLQAEALVWAGQRALELQVIGRIGEHEIDRGLRQPHHLGHAVADQDRIALSLPPVAGRPKNCGRAFRLAAASTRNLKLGGEAERSGTRDTHERKPLDADARSFEPARRLCSILSKGPVIRPPMPLCRFRTVQVILKDI
jgi:hypothetical protein